MSSIITPIPCDDLETVIESHRALGFRLDMIKPADSPREALLSKEAEIVKLVSEPPPLGGGLTSAENMPPAYAGGSDKSTVDSDWVTGRAGMEYRDLIPGRLGGRV